MAEAAFKQPNFHATETNACQTLYGLGSKYRKVFTNFEFENDDHKKDYTRVLAKFDAHFEPKKVTKLYMRKFDSTTQGPGESIGEFVSNLGEVAKYYEFGETLNAQLCKQISSERQTMVGRRDFRANSSKMSPA